MKNGNMPAAPIANESGSPSVGRVVLGNNEAQCSGLTKREHFAALAMQGLSHSTAPDGTWFHDPKTVAAAAVEYADALLAELEKQNEV